MINKIKNPTYALREIDGLYRIVRTTTGEIAKDTQRNAKDGGGSKDKNEMEIKVKYMNLRG